MVKIFKPKASNSLKGQSLTLDVERLDFNGRGVARYQKKPVFVQGALPQEQVIAKINEQTSKFSQGKLTKVIKESPNRVKPNCQYYEQCGGCDLQHLAATEQVSFKQTKVEELFSRQKISQLSWQQPLIKDIWQYRRKARVGVQYKKQGNAVLGFREKSTNNVAQVNQCHVLVPQLSDLLIPLTAVVNQLPVHSIGHIELIFTQSREDKLITLVVRQLKKLTESTKQQWQSFIEQAKKNGDFDIQVLFDLGEKKQVEPLNLPSKLSYIVDDNVCINFESNNFIQVNAQINDGMISQALEWLSLTKQDVVLDLYCGLGNFSLPIAKRVAQVVGIEGVQYMVEKAQDNARNNQLTNVEFYQANLNADWEDALWLSHNYTKILLDPARAGALEACQQLSQFNVTDIVYVSCDPATLARDSVVLLKLGYSISKIAIMEMFGQTKHVETMVLFQRDSS